MDERSTKECADLPIPILSLLLLLSFPVSWVENLVRVYKHPQTQTSRLTAPSDSAPSARQGRISSVSPSHGSDLSDHSHPRPRLRLHPRSSRFCPSPSSSARDALRGSAQLAQQSCSPLRLLLPPPRLLPRPRLPRLLHYCRRRRLPLLRLSLRLFPSLNDYIYTG